MKTIRKINNKAIATALLIGAGAMPACSQNSSFEPSQVKDGIQNLMSMTMKNPIVSGNEIRYRLTSNEVCEIIGGNREGMDPDSAAELDSQCESVSKDFAVSQVIYDESNLNASGKLTWSFGGYRLLSVNYSPNKLILNTKLGEFRSAYLALMSVAGADTNSVSSMLPTAGAIRIVVEHTQSAGSYADISFPEAISHTLLSSSTGLDQDIVLNLAAGSSIKNTTQSETHLLKQNVSLKGVLFRGPASIERTVSDMSGGTKEFSANELSYEAISNLADAVFAINSLKLNNLLAKKDGATLISAQTSGSGTSLAYNMNTQTYSSLSGAGLSLTVNAGTNFDEGLYQISHDANNSIAYNISQNGELSFASNLSNLVIKVPTNLVNRFQPNLLNSNSSFNLSLSKLSGAALMDSSGAVNLDALQIQGLDLNQGAGDANRILTLNTVGSLDGSVSVMSSASQTVQLDAQQTTLGVYNLLGFGNYPLGVYQVGNSAAISVVANRNESNVLSAAFSIPNLTVSTPETMGYSLSASGMSGAVEYNLAGGMVGNILTGTLGNVSVSTPDMGSGQLIQSHPTVISANMSGDPLSFGVSAGTTISFSHSTPGSYGSGNATLVFSPNTSFTMPNAEISSGGITASLSGAPYNEMFAEGGMLHGFAFTGAGSISVAP